MAKRKNKIQIGKFYYIYSGTKHPAFIFAFNSKHKTYISLRFGTTKNKHMTEIHSLQNKNSKQYIHNRPYEVTEKDYVEKELFGFNIYERDIRIINSIKNKSPMRTKRAKARYKK